MVLAYHVIFTAYGFWLPNDPRGSWSDFVWAWELRRFGPATKTTSRRSVASAAHNRAQRLGAKRVLKYTPVMFTGRQALAAIGGFQETAERNGYGIHACSILPEHVHMVIRRHSYHVEQVVRCLKQGATEALTELGLHPLGAFQNRDGSIPTPWARKCWHVFLNDEATIRRAIAHVENNPIKEGKKPQAWRLVSPYEPSGG